MHASIDAGSYGHELLTGGDLNVTVEPNVAQSIVETAERVPTRVDVVAEPLELGVDTSEPVATAASDVTGERDLARLERTTLGIDLVDGRVEMREFAVEADKILVEQGSGPFGEIERQRLLLEIETHDCGGVRVVFVQVTDEWIEQLELVPGPDHRVVGLREVVDGDCVECRSDRGRGVTAWDTRAAEHFGEVGPLRNERGDTHADRVGERPGGEHVAVGVKRECDHVARGQARRVCGCVHAAVALRDRDAVVDGCRLVDAE